MADVVLVGAPYLDRLSAPAWARFVSDYEAYCARSVGPKEPKEPKELISAAVLRLISLRLNEKVDVIGGWEGTIFLRNVSAVFAPSSALESYDKFVAITMSSRAPNMDAVLQYVLQWEKQGMLSCSTMPSDKKLKKLFIKGLKPARLSDRVEFECPKSLEEAKRMAVEEVEKMLKMSREVTMAEGSMRSLTIGRGEAPRGSSVSHGPSVQTNSRTPAGRGSTSLGAYSSAARPTGIGQGYSSVVCYACGTPGHKRGSPQCPMTPRVVERESGARGAGSPSGQWVRSGRDGRGRLVSTHGPPGDSVTSGSAAPVGMSSSQASGRVHTVHHKDEAEVRSELPRVRMQLRGGSGGPAVWVTALLDTGATGSFVSPRIHEQLLQCGVVTRRCNRSYVAAGGGELRPEVEASCHVRVDQTSHAGISRPVELHDWFAVAETGEEVLLGYRLTVESGLLELLSSATSVDEPVGAAAEADLTDDLDFEEDKSEGDLQLPTVPEGPEFDGVRQLVQEFADVFGDLPCDGARVPPMDIELKPGAVLKPIPPRRLSPAMAKVVADQVQEWLVQGIVRPSTSQYSAPLVIVKKKDGGYRICVDYRALNAVTVDVKYPMLNTKALLERMAGKRVLGTIDLRNGFHQIPMTEEAKKLTAFAHPNGLEEFNRLQFGLKNGPAVFQKTMTRVLNGLVGSICEVFVDDIIVYAESIGEFEQNLRQVLSRLRAFDLRAKASKCHLAVPSVEYLGHRVDGDGILLTEERRQGVVSIGKPTTTTQLRSFMGMVNYFRSFIQDFSVIAKPLNRLCSKKVAFEWNDEEQKAFDRLKSAVVQAPMLHHLDYELPITLRTDASTMGIGGVLLQNVGGEERCACFISKAFNEVESRWSTHEQEAFAIYYCVTKLHHHLLGHPFIVETDHRNLCFMEKSTSPKVVRWRLGLLSYEFEIRHIAGKTNVIADCMSRCLRLAGGHETEIAEVHNAIAGHRGVQATERLLRDLGRGWPGMRGDIASYIRNCATCQKIRLSFKDLDIPLVTTEVYDPFEVIAVDTVGPLPEDAQGNKYIVVFIDCFTRFVELCATRGVGARDAAEALLGVVGRYGAPREVRSDNGPQFAARMTEELLELMQVRHSFTLPYRPQANGIVERVNGEVVRHLRALAMDKRVVGVWSTVLPLIQRIVNATPHAAIGVAPATLLFGGAVDLDRAVLKPFLAKERQVPVNEYLESLLRTQEQLLEESRRIQQKEVAAKEMVDPGDMVTYVVGDMVLVTYPNKPPHKLSPRWRGPMEVVERQGPHTYMCKDLSTGKTSLFHVSRMKKFVVAQGCDPVKVAEVDADEYKVEFIVDHRSGRSRRRGDWEFRIRWSGYEPSEDTWLPYKEVKDLEALDVYLKDHPTLPF